MTEEEQRWLFLCIDLEPDQSSIYQASPVQFACIPLLFSTLSLSFLTANPFQQTTVQDFQMLWDSFCQWVQSLGVHTDRIVFVGHNVIGFDLLVLYENCRRHHCDFFAIKWTHVLDTYRLAKFEWKLPLQHHTLSDVFEYIFQKPLVNAHQASVDAMAVADIVTSHYSNQSIPANHLRDIFSLLNQHCRKFLLHKKRRRQEKTHRGLVCKDCGHIVSTYFLHQCASSATISSPLTKRRRLAIGLAA